jgi:hypothetical protein
VAATKAKISLVAILCAMNVKRNAESDLSMALQFSQKPVKNNDATSNEMLAAANKFVGLFSHGLFLCEQIDAAAKEGCSKEKWDGLQKELEKATDAEFESAEDLLSLLMRYYRNQSMVSLAIEELHKAIDEGY